MMLHKTLVSSETGLVPVQALVIYKQTGRGDKHAMTIHQINGDKNGQMQLGHARIASRKALRQVMCAVAKDLIPPPVVTPAEVLSYGGGYCFWWTPPQQRTMFFRNAMMTEAQDGEVDTPACEETVCGQCAQPGLVWAWGSGGWKVWAVKGPERPRADTHLYRAPYFNVFQNHYVCVGNIDIHGVHSDVFSSLVKLEDAFFGSWFTHPNYGHDPKQKLLNHPSGRYGFWAQMVREGRDSFPDEVLVSANTTLLAAIRDYVSTDAARNVAREE